MFAAKIIKEETKIIFLIYGKQPNFSLYTKRYRILTKSLFSTIQYLLGTFPPMDSGAIFLALSSKILKKLLHYFC